MVYRFHLSNIIDIHYQSDVDDNIHLFKFDTLLTYFVFACCIFSPQLFYNHSLNLNFIHPTFDLNWPPDYNSGLIFIAKLS